MIKIQIETLEGTCEWEIKRNGDAYDLIVLKSASAFYRDPGGVWHGRMEDVATIAEIKGLIETCFLTPSASQWVTILDGIRVTIRYASLSGGEVRFTIQDFEMDSPESNILQLLFTMTRRTVADESLSEVMAVLARYIRDPKA